MSERGLSRRQFIVGVTGGIVGPAVGAADALAGAQAPPVPPPPPPGPIQLALTSTRTQLTVAEPLELGLAHAGAADRVAIELRHEDGSLLAFEVPLDRAPGGRIVAAPPGLLKPGAYTIVATDGKSASPPVRLAVHRDEHPSAYFVAAWMHKTADGPTAAAKGGWMYFTSDLVSAAVRKPGPDDVVERYLAARMKPFSMTVIGGGHQLDMDLTNDWGDPWVQRAVSWKMGLATLSNRLYPSAGLHVFDEPGLTWWRFRGADGKVTGMNAFAIPAQVEEFRRLTGKEMPTGPLSETLPRYAAMKGTFIDFVGMRLKYLEEAWWAAVTAVRQVHPPFLTINQVASSYAAGCVVDGVDNRMNRPYRVLNGHGGYSDADGSWGPVICARSYDGWSWDRPHYFLPMWGGWEYARMRQEVWLPWSVKLEGIQYDPAHEWALSGSYLDATAVLEIAEVNRRLALVGDVLRRMPRSLAPVAVLLSHSQYAYDVVTTSDPAGAASGVVAYQSAHRAQVIATMWRAMSAGVAPNWVDEHEVVEKGAGFLRQWAVVYCPGLVFAKPELRDVLERYVAAGGRLVQGERDPLPIAGSTRVSYAYPPNGALPPAGLLLNDLAERRRLLDLAPGFARDLRAWIGPEEYGSNAPPDAMLLSVQRAGDATYLLMANSSQDPDDTRRTQMAPVPLETTINVPPRGVLYDLLNGGAIVRTEGKAPLRLAAGDGACWLHLPAPPGPLRLRVEPAPRAWALDVSITWGATGYLPFRLRVFDPAGNLVEELFRATTPWDGRPLAYGDEAEERGGPDGGPRGAPAIGVTSFERRIPLGANAAAGTWTVEAHELLTFRTTTARATVGAPAAAAVTASASPVSIYFDDARKIVELFAGRAREPPFEKMNWDCRRVFGLDPKRFAVFGPDGAAGEIAAALRAKGMSVAVNPAYAIVPFAREPDHGGTGPVVDHGTANFENVYAHTIVLPGHALGQRSWERGHINRPVTATFPGAGRAYVQWGTGGYQAGFENVWVFGDLAAGVRWLLAAIGGKDLAGESAPLSARVRQVPAVPARLPRRFVLAQEIRLWDTPTGIGASPDGKVIYALLAGGSVAAYDEAGREVWSAPALLQGSCLAVSPRGDRLAVGGFPGLLVLDAANGRVLGGYRAERPGRDQSLGNSGIVTVAWSSDGTIVAGGGLGDASSSAKGGTPPVFPSLVVLDAQGKALPAPGAIKGNVMGVAFVPRTKTLLVGADHLSAIDATTGTVSWKNELAQASAFSFAPDGKTAAAGGWGKQAGSFGLGDGKIIASARFASNVGGVALLPGGDVAVAVWGGTSPLYRLRASAPKPAAMAQGRFAFHDVQWLGADAGVLAAEQGGSLWLLDPGGKARAKLEDGGTTAHRIVARGDEVLAGRMNRVVQRLRIG